MADEKNEYELELFNAKICPFGQRAWFTILQKNIDVNLKDSFKIHWIDLNNKTKEFSEKYALSLGADPTSDGQVPAIQHNGKYITESAVVAAYLDRYYNDESKYGAPLIPKDAFDAAKVDLMSSAIGSHIIGPFYGLLRNTNDSMHEKKVNVLRSKLLSLNDKLLKSSDKGFLLGDRVSMFEILAFPIFYRMEALEALKNVPVVSKWLNLKCEESKGFERLINWYNSCFGLKSVEKMRQVVSTQLLTSLYRGFSVDVELYNNPVCPFGQRAWLALEVKRVKYDFILCSLSSSKTPKEDYFTNAYSRAIGREPTSDGKVPIIKHQRRYFTESGQIVRYVDKMFDNESQYGKSLFAGKDDPVGFHACECLCDWVGSHVMQPFYKILFNDDRQTHKKLIDTLYNDLKELCKRLNQVSESGLLLKDNRISAFEIMAFPFFWRFHLHPLISKTSKKEVPIDKWLEKDSKEFGELKRVQDWYHTIYNHEAIQRVINNKDHPMTIERLAEAYGSGYSKPLKN